MRHITLTLFLLISTLAYCDERPDILGDGFSAETFEMGYDYSGRVSSTLVRCLPIVEGQRAVLYIHGYNDYFFQSEMAHRFQDSGYNFYAIDLRRYGRSLSKDQVPFEVRDLVEYFEDIDAAIEAIKADGADDITLMGHSTGGLIASYYAGTHQDDLPIDRLILNSPFFAQNFGWAMQNILLPVVATLGKYMPTTEITGSSPSLYFESLHRDYHGEWLFDPELKLYYSEPVTMGWIRAIDLAQRDVQGGYSLQIPILLMYSDRSIYLNEWSDEMFDGDAVLNVEHIAKYGNRLGSSVTHAKIEGGMHDLILSKPEVRESAYQAIFRWLNE